MAAVIQMIEQRLTERETEVVRLMCEGKLTKQISHDLGISHRTLEIHRQRAMDKLGARTYAELGRIAEREGLLSVNLT